MLIKTIIYSVVFAVFCSSFLVFGFNRNGPGPLRGLLFFLLIILMFTWVFGGWLTPHGPVNWGVFWLGYLLMAFFVTFLLSALFSHSKPHPKSENRPLSDYTNFEKNSVSYPAEITFGSLFRIMMITLFVFAIIKLFFLV